MLPAGFVELREPGGVAWLRADLATLPLASLWATPAVLPSSRGRGGVGTLELRPGLTAVVRPYRRGGAFGRLLGDRYAAPARARREVEVLAALRADGVPVVSVLGAAARRRRGFWRLRLFTELEPAALPLPAFCAELPRHRRWAIEAAAVAVKLAFSAGLRHPDLHLDNVLVSLRGDRVRAVLVDLDRASLRAPVPERLRDAMLVRMARYLHRHAARLQPLLERGDPLRFLRGLGLSQQACRAAIARLDVKIARSVARHRLLWRKLR
jgi:3-deoxy-D-manno-octulosonic acid kinase